MRQQKTRTTSYNCKLHGSMTLEIHIFAQLSNLFSEELKTKQKIKYTHVMEDFSWRKKWITITESKENVYHVTRQKLHFAHTAYIKLNSGLTIKRFDSEMIFFGLDWEENTFCGINIVGKQMIICAK